MTTVTTDISNGIARVTFQRPEVHNALDEVMIAETTGAFIRLGNDPAVRVIVLGGAGKSFSAGADLGWMQRAATQGSAENEADALRLAALFTAIDTCPKPVIGLVQGAALGGGVGLVACCDIVIAHSAATFGLTEVRIGLIPATISPYVVGKIGVSQARRYMLTGERFGADTAQAIGLVHIVTDDLAAAAEPVLAGLRANGPEAMADTKALIHGVTGQAITPELTALTARRIAARRASDEGREGIAAFLGKRKPDWSH